jgi:hypothetical protein
MVHTIHVDPQRLAPEEKNSEKCILRRLTDAENVIENDFKSEAEMALQRHDAPAHSDMTGEAGSVQDL